MNGSIHREERPGRPVRYRVRWRDRPGANPRSKSFNRLSEARQYLAALQSEMAARARAEGAGYEYLPQHSISLGDAIEAYREDCVKRGLRTNTLTKYDTMAKLLRDYPVLKAKSLRQITPRDLYQVLSGVADKGYKPASVRSFRSYLSGLFAWGVLNGYVEQNPVRDVRSPRHDTYREEHLRALDEHDVLTPAQVDQVCAHLPDWAVRVCLVLAYTGMRQQEAAALRVADWNSRERVLSITKAWTEKDGIGPTKTKAGRRRIGVGSRVAQLLDEAAEGHRPEDALLRAARRDQHYHPPSFRRAFKRALVEAGVPSHFTPHSLRHSAISWWLAAGVPLEEVRRAAGHSSSVVTQTVYAHWVPDRQSVLGSVMDRIAEGF